MSYFPRITELLRRKSQLVIACPIRTLYWLTEYPPTPKGLDLLGSNFGILGNTHSISYPWH